MGILNGDRLGGNGARAGNCKGKEMIKTLAAILFAGCAFAQAPPTVARVYDNQLRAVEAEIVGLVEAMPADKINFAPTNGQFKGVRTFAEQAKHVSAVLYLVAAATLEEKP